MALSKGVPIFLAVFGFFLILLAVILQFYGFHALLVMELKQNVPLRNGSQMWDVWRKTPIPVYMKFWVFNVTNPDEIMKGEKPILKEMGPYTYLEEREKQNITFHDEDDTVSYYQNIIFHFQPDLSKGREDDKITMINAPLVMVAPLFQKLSTYWPVASVVRIAFKELQERPFMRREVGEVLLKGYHEPLLAQLQKIFGVKLLHGNKFGFFYPGAAQILGTFTDETGEEILSKGGILSGERPFYVQKPGDLIFHGINVTKYLNALHDIKRYIKIPPHMIPPEVMHSHGHFSIYGARNNSNDGRYQVYTGVSDLSKFTIIKTFQHKTHVDTWNDRYCDMINGTDGTNFPPLVKKNTRLYSFLSDGCRSLYAKYEKDVQVRGIPGYRFTAPKSLLETPKENPENACFCQNQDKCFPSGALDMKLCRGGPIVLTFPHFYDADPSLLKALDGLKPVAEKHQSFVDLEPTSGGVLQGQKRVQLNIELKPYKNLNDFKNLTEMIFPILWVAEGGALDETYANVVKHQIILPLTIMDVLGWVILAAGALLLLAAFVAYRRWKHASKTV